MARGEERRLDVFFLVITSHHFFQQKPLLASDIFFSSSIHSDPLIRHLNSHLSTTQQPPHKPNNNDCPTHGPDPIALLHGQARGGPTPGSGRVWDST